MTVRVWPDPAPARPSVVSRSTSAPHRFGTIVFAARQHSVSQCQFPGDRILGCWHIQQWKLTNNYSPTPLGDGRKHLENCETQVPVLLTGNAPKLQAPRSEETPDHTDCLSTSGLVIHGVFPAQCLLTTYSVDLSQKSPSARGIPRSIVCCLQEAHSWPTCQPLVKLDKLGRRHGRVVVGPAQVVSCKLAARVLL